MPPTNKERSVAKTQKRGGVKINKIKLCDKTEKYAAQDYINKWEFIPKHLSQGDMLSSKKDKQAFAGVEPGTQQEAFSNVIEDAEPWLQDKNTELEQSGFEKSFRNIELESVPNWVDIIKMYFPSHHTTPSVPEIAKRVGVSHQYTYEVINKSKRALIEAINNLDISASNRRGLEIKLILIQYYVERNKQVKIADLIGSNQKEVQRVTK